MKMAAYFTGRKAFSSLLSTVTVGSTVITSKNVSYCDVQQKNEELLKNQLAEKQRAVLKRRMTPIGRFSLKSETKYNPSNPTFFIALSGEGKNPKDASMQSIQQSGEEIGLSASEFESAWLSRGIPGRHQRFHSTVSKNDDRYFEYKQGKEGALADLSRHTRETLHTSDYREDLKKRIEGLLETPIDVNEKLWEVQISTGTLGKSGAIGMETVKNIKEASSNKGKKMIESLLLFRCHHCLCDAVSLTAVLGDLLDEAEEIREMIRQEILNRRARSASTWMLLKLLKLFQQLTWILLGTITTLFRQGYLMLTTTKNPFLDVLNRESAQDLEIGKSVSWCDFASVDEVKKVAKAIGPKVTLNDVFVSCVTAAVARQLAEHREKLNALDDNSRHASMHLHKHFNVVIPAHLYSGILPPGREVGNFIGAFVARVPGERAEFTSASDRLSEVHSDLYRVRKSPAPFVSYILARMASTWLPNKWASSLLSSANANAAVVVTNSRGLQKKAHLNGRTIESMVGFLPLPPGLPVGIVISSYGSVVSLSINAEKWAVPDTDKFLRWVQEEYKLLCKEALIK